MNTIIQSAAVRLSLGRITLAQYAAILRWAKEA